jgi:hypothetical protein
MPNATVITIPDADNVRQTVSTMDALLVQSGTTVDAAQPDGTGNGSIIALLKGWLVAAGLKADAAYTGSGSAGIIALLKGIFANTSQPSNGSVADTGTKTSSFAGATQQTPAGARGVLIDLLLGTVSGTTPTLSVIFQWSPDGGTTWRNYSNATTNLTATGQALIFGVYPGVSALTTGATITVALNQPLPKTWRLSYTIGGTTPSFAISSVNVTYVD